MSGDLIKRIFDVPAAYLDFLLTQERVRLGLVGDGVLARANELLEDAFVKSFEAEFLKSRTPRRNS